MKIPEEEGFKEMVEGVIDNACDLDEYDNLYFHITFKEIAEEVLTNIKNGVNERTYP